MPCQSVSTWTAMYQLQSQENRFRQCFFIDNMPKEPIPFNFQDKTGEKKEYWGRNQVQLLICILKAQLHCVQFDGRDVFCFSAAKLQKRQCWECLKCCCVYHREIWTCVNKLGCSSLFGTKLQLKPDAVPSIYPGHQPTCWLTSMSIFLVFFSTDWQVRNVLDNASQHYLVKLCDDSCQKQWGPSYLAQGCWWTKFWQSLLKTVSQTMKPLQAEKLRRRSRSVWITWR